MTTREQTQMASLEEKLAAGKCTPKQAIRLRELRRKAQGIVESKHNDLFGTRALQDQNRRVAQQPAFDYTGDSDEQ